MRRQALEWLQSNLAAWRRAFTKEPVRLHDGIVRQMQRWQDDPDLAGVRGADALGQLPAAERADWQKLWKDVEDLRQDAAGTAGRANARHP